MKTKTPPRVYVIETNNNALVAFEAITGREAKQLLKETWFREELSSLKSEGHQIWDGTSSLAVRIGSDNEIAEYRSAASRTTSKETDGLVLAYLVPLDGPV
jgi:hypothetical protein